MGDLRRDSLAVCRRRLAVVLVAASLGGCAAAMPGYTPPEDKPSPLAQLTPFESGTMTQSGAYQPSEAERALECRKLTGSMHVIVARLKDAQNRIRPSGTAATMQSVTTSTMGGSTAGLDIDAETRRERARLEAYNRLLAEKKCATMDIAAELNPATTKR
ncbi:MAG: hypothetical protein KGP27_18005 [Hyphomicrobiales bacterium]|nr:hypothetical protein [Hyphomicrobiales bacterium]